MAEELSQRVKSSKTRVLDLCCGVGISTRALHNAFPDAEAVIGVDSSYEMISMANFLSRHLSMVKPLVNKKGLAYPAAATTFTRANAEMTSFPKESFDLVTVMYAFHEAPKTGRDRILREAARLLGPGGTLAVIDICTDYTPSKSMLAGEPYGKSLNFSFIGHGFVNHLELHSDIMPFLALSSSAGISKKYSQTATYIPWLWKGHLQDSCT